MANNTERGKGELDTRHDQRVSRFRLHHVFHVQLFDLLEESLVLCAVEHDTVGNVAADAEYADAGAYRDREWYDVEASPGAAHADDDAQTEGLVEHAVLFVAVLELVREAEVEARRRACVAEWQVEATKGVLGQTQRDDIVVA